jgi:glycosyltransferase involved in cell wall biosynthesis
LKISWLQGEPGVGKISRRERRDQNEKLRHVVAYLNYDGTVGSIVRIGIDARAIGIYPGLGRYALELLRALARGGPNNAIVALLAPGSGVEEELASLGISPLVTRVPLLSPLNFLGLPRALDSFRFDLFHALFQVAPLLRRTPLVVTVHDLMDLTYADAYSHHSRRRQRLLRAYFRFGIPRSLRRARAILAVSTTTRSELARLFPAHEAKTLVTLEGCADSFRQAVPRERLAECQAVLGLPERYLLYLGSTKRYKNVGGLLAGYTEYRALCRERALPALPLVLAGARRVGDAAVDRVIEALEGDGALIALGPVAEEWMPALYQGAEVFLFLSLEEGFGLPVLEAMAGGTAVIASNRGAVAEVVAGGGRFVPPEAAETLGRTILEVTTDEALRASLRRRGRERAAEFSWDETARRTLAAYERALKSQWWVGKAVVCRGGKTLDNLPPPS